MTNLDKLLKDFKEARSAATEGPWEIDYVGEITSPETDIATILSYENAKNDSLFICLTANNSAKLIKIIEVMNEALSEAQKQLEMYNFAKDEIRVFAASDSVIKALQQVEQIAGQNE